MMIKKLFPIIVVVVFTILSMSYVAFAEEKAASFDADKHFPRRSGDIFLYRETKPDEEEPVTIKRIVGEPTNIESISVSVMPETEITEEGEVGEIAYFASDSVKGFLNYGEDEVGAGCAERLSPAFAIPQGLKVGETVTQTSELTITGESEECADATQALYEVTFEGLETVTVPMGTFEECPRILIKETWKDAGGKTLKEAFKTLFFAPAIGVIKEIDKDVGEEGQEVAELITISNPNTDPYNPVIHPADFVATITNPYMPLTPGTTFIYDGESDGEHEHVEVDVTHETKEILGVTCTVVRDRVWLDEELVEVGDDWLAQDKKGNIWYFGEYVEDIEDGKVVSTAETWEAGVDGARAGIMMRANPQIGIAYRVEYSAGLAEDMAEVLSLSEVVSVPSGTYNNCLKTKDWSPLVPGNIENIYYAPGIGAVLAVDVEGGTARVELVEITTE